MGWLMEGEVTRLRTSSVGDLRLETIAQLSVWL